MATYEVYTSTRTWVEVTVKAPCFNKDIYAALQEARDQFAHHSGHLPANDDDLEILTRDDEIVIRFETNKERVKQVTDRMDADLQEAYAIMAAMITECRHDNSGRCLKHSAAINNKCAYAQARDFLTRIEENPYA